MDTLPYLQAMFQKGNGFLVGSLLLIIRDVTLVNSMRPNRKQYQSLDVEYDF